jgi:hypothetical protein
MFFFLIFQNDFSAALALSGIPIALHCMSSRFVSWHFFHAIWTSDYVSFFYLLITAQVTLRLNCSSLIVFAPLSWPKLPKTSRWAHWRWLTASSCWRIFTRWADSLGFFFYLKINKKDETYRYWIRQWQSKASREDWHLSRQDVSSAPFVI